MLRVHLADASVLGNIDNLLDGAFADYIVVKAHIQIRVPDHMSFADAATLGVGTITVGQGMYQKLKIVQPVVSVEPVRTNEGSKMQEQILIYGGSTATGTLAIQFAKL